MNYKRLESLREQQKITRDTLAKVVGKTRQWYSDVLKFRNLKIEDLESFAKYFNVPITYFFDDDKDHPPYQPNQFEEESVSYLKIEEMNQLKAAMEDVIKAKNQTIKSLEKQIELLEEKTNYLESRLDNGGTAPLKQTEA